MNAPDMIHPASSGRRDEKIAFELNKLEKRLCRLVGQASSDFAMVQEGDRVMVCLSGGKDSYTMLSILMLLKARAPFSFELIAVNLDQKQPGFPEHVLPAYLESVGVPYRIVEADTYSIVKEKIPEGKTTCSLCSRLRRGVLYRVADELGATKIALGHHRDDLVETLFLNMFFGGTMKSMPPKLLSDDGRHVLIRPLAYCAEHDIERYALARAYPIIPCDLCGSQENLQRARVKSMLAQWDKEQPGRVESVFRAMQNVVPSHLADVSRYDFKLLGDPGEPGADGALEEIERRQPVHIAPAARAADLAHLTDLDDLAHPTHPTHPIQPAHPALSLESVNQNRIHFVRRATRGQSESDPVV